MVVGRDFCAKCIDDIRYKKMDGSIIQNSTGKRLYVFTLKVLELGILLVF